MTRYIVRRMVCPVVWLIRDGVDDFVIKSTRRRFVTEAYGPLAGDKTDAHWRFVRSLTVPAIAFKRHLARKQLDVVAHLQGLGVTTDELNEKAAELRDALR